MKNSKTAEEYIMKNETWKKELVMLREILLSTKMTETIKWGVPVYTHQGKNIAGLAAFKSYVGIWFYQGALLKDKQKKLINAQECVTKALRQWRFQSIKEIDKKLVKEYLIEAMSNQEEGKEIKPSARPAISIPDELKEQFSRNFDLKDCFDQLAPYKQREYAEYISEAKREATRNERLYKIIPMILSGAGLNDKYKKC